MLSGISPAQGASCFHSWRWMGLAFLVCSWVSAGSLLAEAVSTDREKTSVTWLAEANAMYWFALAAGGDMELLRAGLEALDRAEAGLEQVADETERDQLARKIAALRIELLEQEEMAHDTINGTLPLFRYLLGRDPLSEWVDDPWVTASMRGGEQLCAVVSAHWIMVPQLNVLYSTKVFHHGDYEAFQPEAGPFAALENELAFIFNLDPRFFNHHRAELADALSEEEFALFQKEGLTPDLAQTLTAAWGLDRILQVRMRELFVEKPWWFYQLSAELYTCAGEVEGRAFTLAMVRDQREKLPWLVFFFFWPLVLMVGLTAWQKLPLLATLAAYFPALGGAVVLLFFLNRWLSRGDMLLAVYWWGVAAVAVVLMLGLPLLFLGFCEKLGHAGRWFLEGKAGRASAMGLAGALASLLGFAAVSARPPGEALALTTLGALAFAYLPARIFEWVLQLDATTHPTASKKKTDWRDWPWPDWAAGAACLVFFGWVAWLVSREDISLPVAAKLTLLASLSALALAGTLLAWRNRWSRDWSALPTLVLTALAAFGAAMSGRAEWLALFTIPFISLVVIRGFSAKREKAKTGVAQTAGAPEMGAKRDWEEIFSDPGNNWPLVQTKSFKDLVNCFAVAKDSVKTGSCQVILVKGAQGVGKARTVLEAAKEAGVSLLCGKCRAEDSYAFIKQAFGRSAAGLIARSGFQEGFEKFISLFPLLGTLNEYIGSRTTDEMISPDEIAMMILKILKANQKDAPFLWVDDIERLSTDGLKVLRALRQNALSQKIPLGLVLSGSNAATWNKFPGEPLEIVWEKKEFTLLIEHVLDKPTTETILDKICQTAAKTSTANGKKSLSSGLIEWVPALVVPWLASLWHRGLLRASEVPTSPLLSIPAEKLPEILEELPKSVLESAAKELEGVTEEIQLLLTIAACDGPRFHIRAVCATAEISLPTTLKLLDQAQDRGLVQDVPEDEIYQFSNLLSQEYLLNTLKIKETTKDSSDEKIRYRQRYHTFHRGLAEFYRQEPGEDYLIEAAYHALQAGGGYVAEAKSIALQAGALCLREGRWNQALENAQFALQRSQPSERSPEYLDAATLYLQAAYYLRAMYSDALLNTMREVACRQPVLESQPSGCAEKHLLLAAELGRVWWVKKQPQVAVEILEMAQSRLQNFGAISKATRIRFFHHLGYARFQFYKSAPNAAHIPQILTPFCEAQAITPADLAAKQERAEMLNSLANVLTGLESSVDASDFQKIPFLLQESLDLKQETGDRAGQAMSYGALGRYHLTSAKKPNLSKSKAHHHLQEAKKAFTQDFVLSLELGDIRGQVLMPCHLGEIALLSGDADLARKNYGESLSIAQRTNDTVSIAFACMGLIRTCILAKDFSSVGKWVSELCSRQTDLPDIKNVIQGLINEMAEVPELTQEVERLRQAFPV